MKTKQILESAEIVRQRPIRPYEWDRTGVNFSKLNRDMAERKEVYKSTLAQGLEDLEIYSPKREMRSDWRYWVAGSHLMEQLRVSGPGYYKITRNRLDDDSTTVVLTKLPGLKEWLALGLDNERLVVDQTAIKASRSAKAENREVRLILSFENRMNDGGGFRLEGGDAPDSSAVGLFTLKPEVEATRKKGFQLVEGERLEVVLRSGSIRHLDARFARAVRPD